MQCSDTVKPMKAVWHKMTCTMKRNLTLCISSWVSELFTTELRGEIFLPLKRKDFFLDFSPAAFIFGEGNRQFSAPGEQGFLMQSTSLFMFGQVCLCMIKRTMGSLDRLSQFSTMSGTVKMAVSFKLCAMPMLRFQFAGWRPSDRYRWSSNDLCYSFWKNLNTRSPLLRREEPSGFFFFFFFLRLTFVSQSDRRRKETNWPPVFVWSLDRRKESLWVALGYTRTWIRSIKLRAAPAAWSTGRRSPRDRGCEMTVKTEGRDRRESSCPIFSAFYPGETN